MSETLNNITNSGPNPNDPHTVYDYGINWAVQTGANEITVQVQARYCPNCYPNDNSAVGCPVLFDNYEPNQYRDCTQGYPEGRYAAVRIKDSSGNVLGIEQFICNQSNWPLDTIHAENFVFSGVSLNPGDTVTVDADFYCCWCGHWYPDPAPLVIAASNTITSYTGDESGIAGNTAAVSATLTDNNLNPLPGKTITFTLDSLSPVTAVANSTGKAETTLPIPSTMTPGIYPVEARFAGDAAYNPSSDTHDFEVMAVVISRGLIF